MPFLDVTGHAFKIGLADCWAAIHKARKRDLWPPLGVGEIREYAFGPFARPIFSVMLVCDVRIFGVLLMADLDLM